MAYKEIPAEPYVTYFKFKLKKDFIEGFYVSSEEGQYGLDITLRACNGRQEGVSFKDGPSDSRRFTAKGALRKQIEKCSLRADNKLLVGFSDEKEVSGTTADGMPKNPMKIYTVRHDDAPVNVPKGAVKKAAPEREPGDDQDEDDLPF